MELSVNKFGSSQLTVTSVTSDLRTGHTCSLAPATQQSGIVSSSLGTTVDSSSSSLTMSDNSQTPPLFLGISDSPQLSLPVESNAASLTGSFCNFSSDSAPAVSSECLLPSASGTSPQPHMSSANHYQHSSTAMLSGGTGQSQISTSAASNSGVFKLAIIGGTDKIVLLLRDYSAVSSMPLASQYETTSEANSMAPLYPTLSPCNVQAAPSQMPDQGQSPSLPYQEAGQKCDHNTGTLGPLLSGEQDSGLQSCTSIGSSLESRASVPQSELVNTLKEVHPASTTQISSIVPPQPITETSFQVMGSSLGIENSLGLQPPSQTLCLPQIPEFPKACSRNTLLLESNPPPELEDVLMVAPVQSANNLLALPPASSLEQKDNTNLEDNKEKLSKPLDANQSPRENQDSPMLPIEAPDVQQLQACFDPLDPEKQSAVENAGLEQNILNLKSQGTLEKEADSNDDSADKTTLMETIQVPQVMKSLDDLDQSKGPMVIKNKDSRAIKLNEVQKKSSTIKAPSDQAKKNKHKAPEPISSAPKAKIKPKSPDCAHLGKVGICNVAASDGAPVKSTKHSKSKPQKAVSSRNGKSKRHSQGMAKGNKDNNSKTAEESKQSGNKVKADEKPTIPQMKQKKTQPELTQETFRMSHSLHTLESAQVFHALGKKIDKKIELPSSQVQGNSSNPKGPQPPPATKRWQDTPHGAKGPEKTSVKRQKIDGSAEKEGSSSPPGKVKLVPLPFLDWERPQVRRVPRRPQSLASSRPAVANPAQPASNSAQPTTVHSVPPTPASLTDPNRPPQPSQQGLARPAQPGSNSPHLTTVHSRQGTSASVKGPARRPRPISNSPSKQGQSDLVQPGSKSAQPTTVHSTRPTASSGKGPARPPRPISNSPSKHGRSDLVQPGSKSAQPTTVHSTRPTASSGKGPARPPRPISNSPSKHGRSDLVQPGSKSAQPTTVHSTQPTAASGKGPARPSWPIPNNPFQPGLTSPTWPDSNSAQPIAVSSSWLTSASSASPKRPAPPIWSPPRPGLTNLTWPTVPQVAASSPEPYKTSACTSSQWEPFGTAMTKHHALPKPQNQDLPHDFANVSGHVVPKPTTNEPRPKRKDMKRRAPLEHEKPAKCSLREVKDVSERQEETETS